MALDYDRVSVLRAIKMLEWLDAEYVLFNVIATPTTTATYRETLGDLIESSYSVLSELRSWLENLGYVVDLKVIAARDVVSGITEEIERGSYSLIILHRKRRRRLAAVGGRFLKSISQKLLETSSVPVLVIPVD